MACGLLNFDLKRGEFQTFEVEIQKWSDNSAFIDKLFAAYDRFYSHSQEVQA
jgi:hypothetical protein